MSEAGSLLLARYVGILAVVAIVVAIAAWSRRRTVPTDRPEGIGGWLILPAIGFAIGPILFFAEALQSYTVLKTVPTRGPLYWLLLGEIVGNVALLLFTIYVAEKFYRRRRSFPTLFVTLLFAQAAFVFLDGLLTRIFFGLVISTEGVIPSVVTRVVVALVWWSYVLQSKRVKNTFVHPKPTQALL
jgi:hypothetical protein